VHLDSPDKQRVKSVIEACLYLERQEQQGPLSLSSMEKQLYVEELRHDRLRQTVDMVRDLEYSEPEKLKQIFMYKVIADEEYESEQRLIKREYRNRMMDPGREVARMEQKRNKVSKFRK
jgi:hypothetical protein